MTIFGNRSPDLADLAPELRFLAGGIMGKAMQQFPWGATPLGAPGRWPQPLKTLVGVMLAAEQPMFVAWGPEHILLYNDAYAPMLADRHPAALGRPFLAVWAEVEAELRPLFDQVFGGDPVHMADIELQLDRPGRSREAHFAFSYTPVRDAAGVIVGLFCACTETTEQIDAERRSAAEACRQQALLQQMPGFVAVLSGPNHVFDYVNDAYVAMTGERDYIDRAVREVFPELDGQGFYELLDGVYSVGEPFTARALPVSLAGEAQPRFLDLLYQPVRREDGSVTGIFVGGYDVTERVRVEHRREALLQLDERLRNIDDTAELSFVASELLGETLSATRVGYGTVNFDAQTITVERNWAAPGYGSVVGTHDFSAYGGYIRDLCRGEVVANGDVALDARTKDNTGSFDALSIAAFLDVPVVELGKLTSQIFVHSAAPRIWTESEIALVRDVAERTRAAIARREAERELRGSEEFNRRVLASSPDCIKVLDLDAKLNFMSEGGMCIMEVDDFATIDGAYWPSFWPGEGHAKALAAVDEATRGGSGRFQGFATTRKGTPRWWDVTVTPINGSDGLPQQLLSVSRDITEQRAAEDRLRELNDTLEERVRERAADLEAAHEQLRQSQKMEAVGQLTGGLAHDFNNLLAGISGSLELIRMRLAQGRTAEVEKYAAAAQGAASRAAALTHRLLAFSRRQTLAPKPTDVKQLVASMVDLIGRTVGPQITLELVNGVGLWPSLIDPSQLENAVLNLCINARDAMPDGGKITIETSNRWLDRRMAQDRGLEPGQYISMCVSDTGTGMTPDIIARAFDPFFTTKPIGVGTGLGLSMIYGFAKQSGGTVSIYSEPGEGTNMCIYLPRHVGDAEETDMAAELADAPRGEGETVLVVDDEPTVRMLVGEVLADLGYNAIEAEDGAAGLKVLNSKTRVDLLVTDVGLPGGMNGRQVADAARIARPDLKVLFITGYAENAVLSHGHLDPGMHVMTKPFAMEALASRIRELIAK